jgi:hypothetical protein
VICLRGLALLVRRRNEGLGVVWVEVRTGFSVASCCADDTAQEVGCNKRIES